MKTFILKSSTLLIGERSWSNLWSIKGIIRGFEIVSGLCVNFHKTKLYEINLKDMQDFLRESICTGYDLQNVTHELTICTTISFAKDMGDFFLSKWSLVCMLFLQPVNNFQGTDFLLLKAWIERVETLYKYRWFHPFVFAWWKTNIISCNYVWVRQIWSKKSGQIISEYAPCVENSVFSLENYITFDPTKIRFNSIYLKNFCAVGCLYFMSL